MVKRLSSAYITTSAIVLASFGSTWVSRHFVFFKTALAVAINDSSDPLNFIFILCH